MYNRIDEKFKVLRSEKKKAMTCFVTSGDPNFSTSKKIINSLPDFGADIIEIGLPFSDPMADGPTIQKSSQRAIKSGINIEKTLEIVDSFRNKNDHTPIILMGYFNPIFQFGLDSFFKRCKKVGVDGLIIVDLPPEEDDLIIKYTSKYNVFNIRLITPTTDTKRLKKISRLSKGFLYYVSVMGITGTKKPSISKVKKSVLAIKKVTNLPILIGFGINSSKQTREINKFADGYVIGSAIINLIEDTKFKKYSSKVILSKIKLFLSNLK